MAKRGESKARHAIVAAIENATDSKPATLSQVVASSKQIALRIVDARMKGPQVIDISYWRAFPNLVKPLADALLRILLKLRSQRSRKQKVNDLRLGFHLFLLG